MDVVQIDTSIPFSRLGIFAMFPFFSACNARSTTAGEDSKSKSLTRASTREGEVKGTTGLKQPTHDCPGGEMHFCPGESSRPDWPDELLFCRLENNPFIR